MVRDGAPPSSIFADDYRRPSSRDSKVYVLSNQDKIILSLMAFLFLYILLPSLVAFSPMASSSFPVVLPPLPLSR